MNQQLQDAGYKILTLEDRARNLAAQGDAAGVAKSNAAIVALCDLALLLSGLGETDRQWLQGKRDRASGLTGHRQVQASKPAKNRREYVGPIFGPFFMVGDEPRDDQPDDKNIPPRKAKP